VHRRGYRFIGTVSPDPEVVDTLGPGQQLLAPSGSSSLSTHHAALSTVSFVGREAELAHLTHTYDLTRRGQRQVLFVTGDAGMGKTTLVDAFTVKLAEKEPLWIGRGQCVEQYGAGEAYLPLLEALSQLCHGPAAETVIAHLRQ
jgi:hypothetical protein